MRRTTLIGVVAVLTVLLMVGGPAAAADQARPYGARYSETVTGMDLAPGDVPSLFGGRCSVASDWVTTLEGSGVATHLGAVSIVLSHCFHLTPSEPPILTGEFTDGRFTMTAANGDELTFMYQGTWVFTPESPGSTLGTAVITSYWTIVGGTGRFTEASGSGREDLVSTFDLLSPLPPVVSGVSVGTIVY